MKSNNEICNTRLKICCAEIALYLSLRFQKKKEINLNSTKCLFRGEINEIIINKVIRFRFDNLT